MTEPRHTLAHYNHVKEHLDKLHHGRRNAHEHTRKLALEMAAERAAEQPQPAPAEAGKP